MLSKLPSRIYRIPAVILIIVCHLYILTNTGFLDWPEMLVYPWLIDKGFAPYRDMLVMYPPLGLYFLTFIFRILGYTPEALRIVAYSIVVLTDVLVYVVAAGIWRRKPVIPVVILGFYAAWHPVYEGNTLWFEHLSLPFLLVSFWAMISFLRARKRQFIVLAGLFLAVSLQIKQTNLWPFMATMLFLLIVGGRDMRQRIRSLALFVAPVLIISGCMLVYMDAKSLAADYLYWVYFYPWSTAVRINSYVVQPSLGQALRVIPPYLFVLLALLGIDDPTNNKKGRQAMVLSAALALVLVFAAWPRWAVFKQLPSLPFAALASGFAFVRFRDYLSPRRFGVLTVIITFLTLTASVRSLYRFYTKQAYGMQDFMGNDVRNGFAGVSRLTGGSDVYIYGRYDFGYLLLNHLPPVRPWTQHFPWMLSRPGLTTLLSAEIDKAEVPYVIMDTVVEDNELTRYISDRYLIEKPVLQDAWLMRRKPDGMVQ
ncbi:hypothetical protein A2Z33_04705 [Candidatus Gottesmanbacteria bacterium RBG_16_52_11]|uniref:Glycosyltransferase RgtA/B/C/D-like domain-containing protein n=1 Tax=Candidatus Gottesmanbacteria bacterium RBG_16_52_11 TaxID=1798374 RepID=A0A1F5YU72_9BACT|nr:MAG: hypothetical protein A2Z33_04705 [Candidatus Gottesmanbacteria bacterium RBG_16_52_11]